MNASLRDMVRSGGLKTPVQRGFTPTAWDRALKTIAAPTLDDEHLHRSAIFFGAQLEGLRAFLVGRPPPSGSAARRIRRSVGIANRDCVNAERTALSMPAAAKRWSHGIADHTIDLGRGANQATVAELAETVVDGLRFELAALSGEAQASELSKTDAVRRVAMRLNLSVFYHVLEEQWLDCLHHGWSVAAVEGTTFIAPFADARCAEDSAVGDYRQQALDLELVFGAQAALQGLNHQPNVLRRSSSRAGSYDVAKASKAVALEIATGRILAAEPDLRPYFGEHVDHELGVTIQDMLDVLAPLGALARDAEARMPLNEEVKSTDQLEQFAAIHDLPTLARALHQCTTLPPPKCNRALELLTWRGVRDSLWHRPLVPIDERRVVMVQPAARAPNLRRSIEYWLAEGGNDLAGRGELFESFLRAELAEGIHSNDILRGLATVVPHTVAPSDATIGDIDLLAYVVDTVLVGEIKCMRRPATSHEWFQHDDRLAEGVDQALRKAQWLRGNTSWLANVTGRNFTEARVLPCVVLNSTAGALRVLRGVPIVDRYILDRFFAVGYGSRFATVDNEGIRQPFYSTAAEAANRLEAYLISPPHLHHFRDSLQLATRSQPNFGGPDHVVSLSPQVRLGIPDFDGAPMDRGQHPAPGKSGASG
jgi:hypothetical protein